MSTVCLCLFFKAPEPGRTKTRLEPALGRAGARALSRALVRDAIETWRSSSALVQVHTIGRLDGEVAQELGELRSWAQLGEDLGERMENALRIGLQHSPIAAVVGTDMPSLSAEIIDEIERVMRDCDAVLVPADDGGFGLLALRSCPLGLLDGIPWSSPQTCSDTHRRLREQGLRVAMLPTRFDVDRASDLGKLAQLVSREPNRHRHLRAFLSSQDNQAISVIMPVHNEAKTLSEALDALAEHAGLTEILVVDGGSSDGSDAIAEQHQDVTLLRSGRGRGLQMNVGARAAMGGTLLFLHADVRLPPGAGTAIREALAAPEVHAGAFHIKTSYDPQARARSWIRPFLPLADLRSRYSALPYGDQGIFVRREHFWRAGGYEEIALFEDLALSQRLHEQAPLRVLPGPVRVSARRFQERPLYYLALMNTLPLLFRLGVSPERLERWYLATR